MCSHEVPSTSASQISQCKPPPTSSSIRVCQPRRPIIFGAIFVVAAFLLAYNGPFANATDAQIEPKAKNLVEMPISDWHYGGNSNNQQNAFRHQNGPSKSLSSASAPLPLDMSPLEVWRRHQQALRQHWQQQQQQQQAPQQVVGWPNSFAVVASPQNGGGVELVKKVPTSPYDSGIPRFRSPYRMPDRNRSGTGGGLRRLVISKEEEEEEGQEMASEEREREVARQQMTMREKLRQFQQQQQLQQPSDPSTNNLERYMPLLARHRPRPKNMTTHWSLANSAEILPPEERTSHAGGAEAEPEESDEDDEENAGGSGSQFSGTSGPCLSANCKTWITITIPSELVGLGAGNGQPQQKPEGGENKASTKVPQTPSPTSKPMQLISPVPKSRGMPAARVKNAGSGTKSTEQGQPTRAPPPDFLFSTSFILPVNGISIRPNVTMATTATPSMTTTNGASITTATVGGGTPWVRPFTIRPKVPSSASSQVPPRGRPAKVRPPKPWTHSGAGAEKASNVPKARPPESSSAGNRPSPTTDTTIEQAAIWVSDWMRKIRSRIWEDQNDESANLNPEASTELIDAIREALAKFRATLTRRGKAAAAAAQRQHGEPGEAIEEGELMREQLQTAWDSLKGTWFEQAVAEIAMDAAAASGNAEGTPTISRDKIADLLQQLLKDEEEGKQQEERTKSDRTPQK